VHYTNVDPLCDYGVGNYSSVVERIFHVLNRSYGTDVELKRASLPEAELPAESVDVVYTLSAIEHFPPGVVRDTVSAVERILKPGGFFVLTVDLFLNLFPFTSRHTNQFGVNTSIRDLIEASGMELVHGTPSELYGFDEFDPDRVLSHLEDYFIGDL